MNHAIAAKRNGYLDGWTSDPAELYLIIPEVKNKYFAIGAADKGREVINGPVTENLVYLFPRATFIDNNGGTRADVERAGFVEVSLGDTITFLNRVFTVEAETDGYNARLREVL